MSDPIEEGMIRRRQYRGFTDITFGLVSGRHPNRNAVPTLLLPPGSPFMWELLTPIMTPQGLVDHPQILAGMAAARPA